MNNIADFFKKPIISLCILFIILFAIIDILGKILIPFCLSAIISYILFPFINKINSKFGIKLKIISAICSSILFLILISIPIFILPNFLNQIVHFLFDVPVIIDFINNKILLNINLHYGFKLHINNNIINNFIKNNIMSIYNNHALVTPIAKNGVNILEILLYILLTPFVLFYTILNWQFLLKFFESFIPRSHVKTFTLIIKDIDKLLSSYLRGQLLVILVMMFYYTVMLNYIKLDNATLIGILSASLIFIPYLGILTSFISAILIALSELSNPDILLSISLVYLFGHIIESWLATPFLVGARIGLNPIMIIFTLITFSKLFGIIGVLLSIPFTIVMLVSFKYLKNYYFNSDYYKL